MIISVVGMGKIGLPLAIQYASKGHTVTGVDISQKTVDLVNAGQEPFPGEAGLAEALPKLTQKGLLTATTSYESAIPPSDAVVVVVPLFVDAKDQPDFGWMDSATKSIGTNLAANTLVIYETTLPIGTTRNRWKPMLELESGLKEGQDFHLVFSPERVLTGRIFEDLRKYPKLVGALSSQGAKEAISFYNSVLEFDARDDLAEGNGVWDLGSAEAAEMAKLAETTYRDVNIALANQFALHAQKVKVDIYRVIEACNSQPFSQIHRPGISVGGHCIPVYPRLYLATDHSGGVVDAARKLNAEMPKRLIKELASRIGDFHNVNVLVMGVAYRPGVKESAFSGVFDLVLELEGLGATAWVVDPLYSEEEILNLGLRPYDPLIPPRALIVHTDHKEFLDFEQSEFPNVELVLDGRNSGIGKDWSDIELIRLGVGAGNPTRRSLATGDVAN
jgi:nucleotide sugar dehydrogenase